MYNLKYHYTITRMECNAERERMSSKSMVYGPSCHTLQAHVIRVVVREISVRVSLHLRPIFLPRIFLSHRVVIALRICHGCQYQNPVIHQIVDPFVCLVLS